jgi:predicted ATPase
MAQIKSFKITGLFGTDTVFIPFEDKVKILIGENGIGKTQVLNIFYYALTKNLFKLSRCHFQTLEIVLENGKRLFIEKDLIKELTREVNSYLKRYEQKYRSDLFDTDERDMISRHQIERLRKYEKVLERQVDEYFQDNTFYKSIFNSGVLYFPTYRRVEEDLHNLGYNNRYLQVRQDNLIQFGMDDVKARFNSIENTIDRLLKEGLSQFTKDILTVVIDDSNPNKEILEKIDEKDLEIILSRIGDQIPEAQKNAVKNAVANNEIRNPLSAYLLQKLVDVYEKQKELDNSVKKFRDVCNKYLENKKVYYDESAIEIYIKSTRTNEKIDLKHLSSGEKQIISIFSKVYLAKQDERFTILFDEPELSLSMPWQKQLLPDIMASNKCDFLLAVTHSPFIFDNELDQYAVGINEYISFKEELPQS